MGIRITAGAIVDTMAIHAPSSADKVAGKHARDGSKKESEPVILR
jgi:hypothetical protein